MLIIQFVINDEFRRVKLDLDAGWGLSVASILLSEILDVKSIASLGISNYSIYLYYMKIYVIYLT